MGALSVSKNDHSNTRRCHAVVDPRPAPSRSRAIVLQGRISPTPYINTVVRCLVRLPSSLRSCALPFLILISIHLLALLSRPAAGMSLVAIQILTGPSRMCCTPSRNNKRHLPRRATRLSVSLRWPARAKTGKTASALRTSDLRSTDSTCSSSSATWNDVRFELKHRARMGAT